MGPMVMTGGLFRWNTLNYWLAAVALLFASYLLKRPEVHSRLLFALLAVLVCGIVWSPNPAEGVDICLNVFSFFGLLVYFWRTSGDDDALQWMGLVSGFVGAVGGLVFRIEGNAIASINANAWAAFPLTAVISIFLVSTASRVSPPRQFLLAILAIVNCGWIFLIGSRGSMLTSVVLIVPVLTTIRGAHLKVILVAGGVLVGSAIIVRFSEQVAFSQKRISVLLDPETRPRDRTSGRSELVIAGVHIFGESPILGAGTGGFSARWVKIEALEGLSSWHAGKKTEAHSGWIRTLAENGLPGILLHVLFVTSFAVVGWRKRKQGLLIPGLVVTGALATAYISSDFNGKAMWFLAAGMAVLLNRRSIPKFLDRRVGNGLGTASRGIRSTSPAFATRTSRTHGRSPS
ncbi:MAG: O-antigen ligase family protein [Acidobacteriota bacterium]|nr:O-antigen ligase family protein [Acidobacteriota bacterium]